MPRNTRHYTVTRRFIEGVLKGMSYTADTTVLFEEGKVYGGHYTGTSKYLVTRVC